MFKDLTLETSTLLQNGLYLALLILVLLVIIFVLYKTYRASLNVEARLNEFSSLSSDNFGKRLNLIEVNSVEHRLNTKALGPLARIIDAYCVVTTDMDGIVTYANEKYLRLAGASAREVIGKRFVAAIKYADANDLNRKADADSLARHGEIKGINKQGKSFWIDAFVFPIALLSDVDSGYLYFGTDMTHLKLHNNQLMKKVEKHEQKLSEVENMLMHSEKMASLGTISAGIAHEINNPIAYTAANVERFEEYISAVSQALHNIASAIGEEKYRKLMKIADLSENDIKNINYIVDDYPALISETRDGIMRVQRIIADLKCFSHESKDEFNQLNLHQCIDGALNLAQHEFKNKVCINKELDDQLPAIAGSESLLSQVFVNLVVNAAQAMDGNGSITIRTRHDHDAVVVEFEDTGPGIPDDVIQNIFEPFYTTKPVGKGTGLGLSISQDIIKRHNGNISVSNLPAGGCRFSISLPTWQSASNHAA